MRVKDIMTEDVITVTEDATLLQALRKLVDSKVSALVVIGDSGEPIGVLSEGDLMRRAELGTDKPRRGWFEFLSGGGHAAEDYILSHGRQVAELMTRSALTIHEDAEIKDAVDVMIANKVKRLVVVRDRKAIGVLARSDLLKALLAALDRPEVVRSDDQIFTDIIGRMSKQSWAPRGSIHTDVADGVVTLEGAIADERLRGALKVLIETVPGVRSVRDKLAWIEPESGYLVVHPED
jgi:CBS domain-containing protein